METTSHNKIKIYPDIEFTNGVFHYKITYCVDTTTLYIEVYNTITFLFWQKIIVQNNNYNLNLSDSFKSLILPTPEMIYELFDDHVQSRSNSMMHIIFPDNDQNTSQLILMISIEYDVRGKKERKIIPIHLDPKNISDKDLTDLKLANVRNDMKDTDTNIRIDVKYLQYELDWTKEKLGMTKEELTDTKDKLEKTQKELTKMKKTMKKFKRFMKQSQSRSSEQEHEQEQNTLITFNNKYCTKTECYNAIETIKNEIEMDYKRECMKVLALARLYAKKEITLMKMREKHNSNILKKECDNFHAILKDQLEINKSACMEYSYDRCNEMNSHYRKELDLQLKFMEQSLNAGLKILKHDMLDTIKKELENYYAKNECDVRFIKIQKSEFLDDIF